MKIVLLCSTQFNQVALAHKVASQFNLAGIVIQQPMIKPIHSFSLPQLFEKLLNRTVFGPLQTSWSNLLNHYKQRYPGFPNTQQIVVEKINSDATVEFIQRVKPDLLMVSGTSILNKKVLDLVVPLGIVNLHTGLSPYMKGGPNCTNWCLSEEKFHLIGNTIMWIDAGIDSGDIITTERTLLNGQENLTQLHMKVMEHAHALYLAVLKRIAADPAHVPRVKQQSIVSGTTYYTRQWNYKAKWRLFKNLKKLPAYFQSAQYKTDSGTVKTIPL